MGSPRKEYGAAARADVQVEVTLTHPFLIGQTEVTQGAWTSVGFPNVSGSGPSASDCIASNCPAGNMKWIEAAAYANALSRMQSPPLPECYSLEGCTGAVGVDFACRTVQPSPLTVYPCLGFRLPTEAEWECAARAGTTTAFYSGDIEPQPTIGACAHDANLEKIAWYCQNSGKVTHPVGEKLPNAWGLFDMSGNAAEWVADYYDGSGYGTGPLIDPVNNDSSLEIRPLRGGSASLPSITAKSAFRFAIPPNIHEFAIGFRLVRTLPK